MNNVWDNLSRLVVALLMLAIVLGAVVVYEPVVEVNQRMREEKLALDKKIEEEAKIARRLETQLHSFNTPAQEKTLVERLARERLSYAKPGENVIHFESPAVPGR